MSQRFKKISSRITSFVLAAVCLVAGSLFFPGEYQALDNGALICETGGIEKLAACLDKRGLNQLSSYDASKQYVFLHNGEGGQYVIIEIEETSELRMFMYPTGGNLQLNLMAYDGYIDSYKIWYNDYSSTMDDSNYWYFVGSDSNVNPSSYYGEAVCSILVEGSYDYKYFQPDIGIFAGVIYSDINIVLEAYLCKDYGWNWQSYIVDFDKYNLSVTGSDYDRLMAQLNSVGITSLPAEFNSSYNHILYKNVVDGVVTYNLIGFSSLDLVDISMYLSTGSETYLNSNIQPLDSVFDGFYMCYYKTNSNKWSLFQKTATRFSIGYRGYINTDETGLYENFNVDENFLYSDFNLYFTGKAVSEYGWPAVLYVDDDNTLTEEAPVPDIPDNPDRPDGGGFETEDPDVEPDSGDWSGSPLPDDAIDDVGKAEDELFKPGEDIDLDESIKVEINADASSYIWSVIDSFLTNSKVFSFFVTMLSLGIIGLILGR